MTSALFLDDPLDWEIRGSSSLGPFQCKSSLGSRLSTLMLTTLTFICISYSLEITGGEGRRSCMFLLFVQCYARYFTFNLDCLHLFFVSVFWEYYVVDIIVFFILEIQTLFISTNFLSNLEVQNLSYLTLLAR